jgi:hypothetical protein
MRHICTHEIFAALVNLFTGTGYSQIESALAIHSLRHTSHFSATHLLSERPTQQLGTMPAYHLLLELDSGTHSQLLKISEFG